MGDFNINLLNCENHSESSDFLNMMNTSYLLPYILQPTRMHITERSATPIDNIFANTFTYNATSGNLITKISDHLPQFLIIEDLKVNFKTLNYYKNDYSIFNEETFVDEFAHLDWSNIYNNNLDINSKFNIFTTKSPLLSIAMYLVKNSLRKKLNYPLKPWITKVIVKMKQR